MRGMERAMKDYVQAQDLYDGEMGKNMVGWSPRWTLFKGLCVSQRVVM
jgi:hypothetical protein